LKEGFEPKKRETPFRILKRVGDQKDIEPLPRADGVVAPLYLVHLGTA